MSRVSIETRAKIGLIWLEAVDHHPEVVDARGLDPRHRDGEEDDEQP